MRNNLKTSRIVIVAMVATIVLGTLLNFGRPTLSEAYTKTEGNTTALPSDLFVDRSVNNTINRPLSASTTPSNIVEDSTSNDTRDSRKGMVRLAGEVPSALARATRLPEKMAADAPLTLTIILKHTDQAGFDRYFKEVYDERLPSFRARCRTYVRLPHPQISHLNLRWQHHRLRVTAERRDAS